MYHNISLVLATPTYLHTSTSKSICISAQSHKACLLHSRSGSLYAGLCFLQRSAPQGCNAFTNHTGRALMPAHLYSISCASSEKQNLPLLAAMGISIATANRTRRRFDDSVLLGRGCCITCPGRQLNIGGDQVH